MSSPRVIRRPPHRTPIRRDDDPLISGIGWVSELVEIAGGIDIFADRGNQGAARDRVVTAEEVVAWEPDLALLRPDFTRLFKLTTPVDGLIRIVGPLASLPNDR
jgi:hypothetical protein